MSAPRRLALAVLLLGGLGCPPPPGDRDVVVVTLDTVRADHLGCYGSASASTPNLDRLAAKSVLFEDASCAVPLTLPSHAALFTGRYPTATGVRNNGTFVVPASETTLAEVLREAGYATGAVVAAFPLQSRYGLAQGFGIYDEQLPAPPAAQGQAFSVHFSERDARAVTDRALEVWGRLKGRRFLWVHYFDAHAPYTPPEPYAAAHPGAPYDGEIAFVDAELGRLLAKIEADSPRAVVVVAADHGESLGEHGEKTHGVFVYQSTVRVPLIVHDADRWPEGRRVAEPVSLVDVMPTVLAMVHVAPPRALDGGSLLSLASGGVAPTRTVYAESYLPRLQFRFSPLTMIRGGRMKLIDAPTPELYDLASDLAEAKSLPRDSGEGPALASRLAAFLQHEDPEASARAAGALDAEAEARLRSLGYAGAGSLASKERGRDPKTMTDYLARYDRAVGLVAAGQAEEGRAELERLVPEAPENYMARYQLAAALVTLGRNEEAAKALREVVRLAPEFASAHTMLALALHATGDLDGAVAEFDAAAALSPTQAEPLLAKGRALQQRGRFDAAAEAFHAAIEREPNADDPVRALVALRAGRGDLPRAISDLQALTARFPRSAALWEALALTARKQGDQATAASAIRKVRELDPARLGLDR